MLNSTSVPCVFAHLALECPSASAVEVENPPGKAPSMSDVITIHIPLPMGSAVREEIEATICPGIADHEQMLDQSDDEKPGSVKITVSRKKWGTYLLLLAVEGVGAPVLRMDGAKLKGKPDVSIFKGVPPILEISMRGLLTDNSGETSDEIRRRWVHSRMLLTLAEQQTKISESDANDLDAATEVVVPPASRPSSEQVAGSTAVGPRSDALPEHDFTSEFTKRTAVQCDLVFPGFIWAAIQSRQRSKPGAPVILGWADLTAAAQIKGCISDMKSIRQQVEAD